MSDVRKKKKKKKKQGKEKERKIGKAWKKKCRLRHHIEENPFSMAHA